MSPTTLDRVIAAVAAEFMVDPAGLGPATTALDVPGWDSIAHAMLVMRLEDSFGRPVDGVLLQHAANLGGLAAAIDSTA